MIDAFATSENMKLPLYMSPIPDQGAYAIDALSTPWAGLCLYNYVPSYENSIEGTQEISSRTV